MNQCRSISCWWQFFFCLVHSRILLRTQYGISFGLANQGPDFSPSAFSYRHNSGNEQKDVSEEIDLGTTLVAIKYKGGVVVGADTRTSVGGYVSNKFAYKINPIFEPNDEMSILNNHLGSTTSKSSCVLCRSGSAADTQWLAKHAKRRFAMRQLERPGYLPRVSEVAHYLRHQMRHSKNDYQASLICAGYDETEGSKIFGITPGGSLWEEPNFCVSGSGSTILLGYLDDALQTGDFCKSLNKDEAIALVTKLLRLSIRRDGSSGGLVRLYVIDESGLEEKTIYPSEGVTESAKGASEEGYKELKGFATPKM